VNAYFFIANKETEAGATNGQKLPQPIEMLKQRANIEFEKQNYTLAINLYNCAITESPKAAVLYSNRAAAYIRRDW